MNLDSGIVIAIIALVSSIVINALQFLSQRSQGKKAETEAAGILIDMALKVNKQEMDIMRQVVSDLKVELREKEERISALETEIESLHKELTSYKKILDKLG